MARPSFAGFLGMFTCVVTCISAVGCRAPSPEERILRAWHVDAPHARTQVDYPLPNTVFPPELPPPLFHWHDPEKSASWLVKVTLPDDPSPVLARVQSPEWRPTELQWLRMQTSTQVRSASVAILGVQAETEPRVVSVGETRFSTAPEHVGAPIFYREVELPFIEAVKHPERIRWRFGAISSRTPPPVVLTGLPVCGNCHSFSKDGKTLGLDIDYANDKGSYALVETAPDMNLTKDRIITWSDYQRADKAPTFGLLSSVSPDGRYVVSTVKDRSVFVPRPNLAFSQLFFPVQGVLAVYDRQTKSFRSLPGADDPQYVQSNASWSPDGQTLVFARAKAEDLHVTHDNVLLTAAEAEEFTSGRKVFRFDLYTVPFNGGLGGVARPLTGASNNGASNFFGRYSPDGKWIAFTRANSFMLLQPDSELYLVPAAGGQERRMRCNTSRMNSWHSWSPNGRWLVFSSKANGPYTQLFLAHVDANGLDAPAALLDRLTTTGRAANIPEFVAVAPDAIRSIRDRFTDDDSYTRAGMQELDRGDFALAQERLATALKLDPQSFEAQFGMGAALAFQRRFDEATAYFQTALRLRPDDADTLRNLGHAFWAKEATDQALRYFEQGIRAHPNDVALLDDTAQLLIELRRLPEALVHMRAAVAVEPGNADRHLACGQVLQGMGQSSEAVAHVRKALELRPGWRPAQAMLQRMQAQ